MVKKILVVVSACYLLLFGVAYMVVAIYMRFWQPVMTGYAYAILALLLLIVGIGIFCKMNWARIGLLIMSGYTLYSGIFNFSVLFHRSGMPKEPFVAIVLVSIPTVLVPTFFLVLFTRSSVKEMFGAHIRNKGNDQ